jgi:hypothetical protein
MSGSCRIEFNFSHQEVPKILKYFSYIITCKNSFPGAMILRNLILLNRTACATGQQRMITPPRHLILPSHLSGPTLDFVFAFWIMITFYTLFTSLFNIYTISRSFHVNSCFSGLVVLEEIFEIFFLYKHMQKLFSLLWLQPTPGG